MRTTHLSLEFAPGAKRSARVASAVLVTAVLALVVCALQLGQLLAESRRQADHLAALQARREALRPGAPRTAPPAPADAARARVVRQVASHLMTPWADLLESLETAPNQAVALLSVEPSVDKQSLRLTAESRDAQDMLAYLAALQRDPRMSAVVLVSHQVQLQAPGTPVRFQIQATWGAAP